MAAGLGFKDFTTGEVLTAADVDGYLMQGIWVFASTAARDAAVTAPAEGNFAFTKDTNSLWYYDGAAWVASGATGDIEGVTAGVGISGGGTSGTVTVTNSMATAITTAGDTLYGTGSGTFSRLGIGTAGQVLKVNSGATAPEWGAAGGGGLVLISSTTIGSAVTTVTVTGAFSSTYDNYRIILSGGVASEAMGIKLQLGSTTTGYYSFAVEGSSSGSTVTGTAQSNVAAFTSPFAGSANALSGIIDLQSPNLAKRTGLYGTRVRFETPGGVVILNGFENSNTQHTAFTLDTGGGSATLTGGTIKVYGYAN